MKEFFSQIHYSHNLTAAEKISSLFLAVGVPFYWAGAQIKNLLYDKKILKPKKIHGAYVISIGNITTGGVGKTPIVASIANFLSNSHKVAIVSRGYGGKLSSKEVHLIKNDGKIFYDAKECGDEPFWLSENTNYNISVITCKNRVTGAKYAVEKLGCDVIILDDGFQHRKIERDLNIVVFDAAKLAGNGHVLPLGPLREPLCNIKRSDKIIITNKNLTQNSFNKITENILKEFAKPCYQIKFTPEKYYNIQTNAPIEIENKKIGAFCAIGQPNSFYNYLNKNNLIFVKTFSDHHLYTQKDMDNLSQKAKEFGVEMLITTEKDAVKLNTLNFNNTTICAMKLGIDLNTEELLGEEA